MSVATGCEGAVCGGKSSLGSDGVGKGTVRGGESGSESGGVSGTLCKTGRSEVVEPGKQNAEAVTGGAKKTLKRRTRRTHCGHRGFV